MKSVYCTHCNIEHPPINGLLSNEIVRESHSFEYRTFTYMIWIVENPNRHWWGWGIPIGKTEQIFDEIRKLGFLPFEDYYIPSYLYREASLTTKALARSDAQEGLKDRTDTILDILLSDAQDKLDKLRAILNKEG